MFTIARPPRIQPTSELASAISLSEMPPVPIRTPIVIKKGTAIREKDQTPFTICRGSTVRFWPMLIRHSTVEIPTEYAMGKRRKIIMRKLPSRISVERVSPLITPEPPFLYYP